MSACIAVLDVGKTNVKVIAFDRDFHVVAERSRRNGPLEATPDTPYLHLDTGTVWDFLIHSLKEIGAEHRIEAISISAHGAAGALVTPGGEALAPMDYEFGGYDVDAHDYAAARAPFAETLSPNVPRGLNLGRQLFYMRRHFPERAAKATAILCYAQYWAWRLSGAMASEATSLGAHTDLWNPNERRLSSMVERQGWTPLFPPMRKAWERLGPIRPEVAAATGLDRATPVLCGAHDSNASLVPHLLANADPFTLVSTGTWVIVMSVGGSADLDESADMLANVDVRGEPVPSARFMGGREFAVLAGETPAEPAREDIAAIIAAGTFALPSFSDQGGPFSGREGRIEGPPPSTDRARAALASLYAASMTAYLIGRLGGRGDVLIEGGFARTPAFAGLLAALTGRRVRVATSTAGAAEGAARLALWGEAQKLPELKTEPPWEIDGLRDYYQRWLKRLA